MYCRSASLAIVLLCVVISSSAHARFYDPVIGRFISRDPVDNVDVQMGVAPVAGVPVAPRYVSRGPTHTAGPNAYEYVRSAPTVYVDPNGLTALKIENVSGPTPGSCGKVNWTIRWKLDPKPTESGSIIQELHVTGQIEHCSGFPFPETIDSQYAESWPVLEGDIGDIDIATDSFWNKERGSCTKGWMKWEGKAGWHANYEEGPEWELARGPAGTLPHFPIGRPPYRPDHRPYDPTVNTVVHTLEIKWDCCRGVPYSNDTEIVSHTP